MPDDNEKKISLEKLSEILSTIQNIYYKKNEQIEELQQEIADLKDVLNYLNSIISTQSFHSADELYQKAKNKLENSDLPIEEYFQEEIPDDNAKGTKIKSKIFSEDDNLLCILNFIDSNMIDIKFIEPEVRNIQETSEDFIGIFVREALLPIKDKNPELEVNYRHYKDSNIIENIEILNIKSIKDFDLIVTKLRELLL
jgi:hypothetical protein